MNFAGPFVSEPSHVSPVSLGGDGFTFNKPGFIQHNPSDSHVVIPDAHLLFSGDYTRIGSDLIISGDGQKLVVGNYFKGETRPALTSKDGATLAGHVVDALTGHVHYAQANAAAPAAGQVIGNVLKLSGSASAIRNGVSIELHIGDAIQKGDVIQTGSDSSIGMTFVDGSAFGMTSNARMVMNEMIYDPNGSSNSSLISLVQGTITFVAGQTAKNGNMRVETPVATMGIRGTAVLVEIGANDGPTKFSVLVEPDGHTGSYNLYDKATGQLIGTVSQAGQVTFVTSLGLGQPPSAIEQLKTLQDQQNEKAIIQQVFQLYFPNYNPDDSNPKSPKFGHNTSGNNLAEIIFTTNSNAQQTFLTQIELRFAVTDPITGITTYQNKIFYNAKASFSADSVFGNQAFVPTTESFKFADVVKIDDPDIGNAPFYDIGVPFVAGSAIIKSAVSTIPQMSEAFLKSLLSINQTTGLVSFDRQQFNFLDDGQTVTFKIQVTATSGPDTGLVEIPVTITGENDAPTIVVGAATTVTGDVKEDVAITSGHIGTNGKITFQDFDLTDAHAATVDLTSTASSLPHFVAGTEIGHFTIDPVAENLTDTNNHGTVGWHFTLNDNDPTLQSLAEGQTITQTYTITITDNNGIPVTQTVTITITGTNDAPMLAADTSVHQADEVVNTTNSSVEDVVNGSLSFTDVDLSDTHTATAALHPGTSSVVWSGGAYSGIPSATLAALGTAMKTTVNDSTDTGAGSVGWEFKLPDHLFDFLADGETLTLTYDVTITDNNGVSSTQQVTVQVGAANDQPVISVIDNSSTLQEDVGVQPGNLLTDSGSVTFTDTDLTDTHTAHVIFNNAVGGNGGSVNTALLTALGTALSVPSSALATGVHTFGWDFALNNSLVQYLGAGETVTATYTITVGDSSGDSNDTSIGQTVTVVLTGTNDTPVITAVDVSGAVTEDTALEPGNVLHDTGSVTFADADATDHETASVAFVGDTTTSAAAIPGVLHTALQNALTLQNDSFTSNTGTITWDFNLDNSLVQYLAEGETISVTYTITVKDDSGTATDTSATQTVTVVITGTNDTPVITAVDVSGAVKEDTALESGNVLHDTGSVTFADADLTDHATASFAFVGDATTSAAAIPLGLHTALQNALTLQNDSFTSNTGTINWDFNLDNGLVQYLAEGETITATYTITVKDDSGTATDTSATQTVTVVITGTNDTPVITAVDVSGAVTEDTALEAGNVLHDTGSVTFADADLTDHATASFAFVGDTTTSAAAIPGALHTALQNALTLQNDSFTSNTGTITWDFNLDNSLVQYLAEGETITVTYTITVQDDSSTATDTSATQTVTVVITGTNDTPVITAVDVSGAVKEDTALEAGNVLHDTGSVTFADADLTDHATASFAFVGDATTSAAAIPGGLHTALQSALTLQNDSFTSNTGTINWDFNLDNGLVQYLAEGETITVTYTITVKDDSGTATDTSATQTVTVVITGTNDAPVVSGAVTDINAVEDGSVSVLDALANASDVDNGAVLSVVDVPGTLPAGVTYDAVHHTFTLDPGNAAYQHLADGHTTVVTVNYGVTDGVVTTPTAASVSWTITGTNDAPTVSGAATSTVAEDASASTLNALANASDLDDGAVLTVVNVPGTLPAGVTYDAVNHTFTLDPADPAYQHLGVGQSTVVTVNYGVTDGVVPTPTAASVSWTITGTNDDPTVTAPLTISTTEGDAPVVRDLLLGASDVDTGDTLSIENITYSIDGGSSTTVTPDGITFPDVHTLNIDAAGIHHIPAGETEIIVVSYDIVDGNGGVVAQTETITVTGTNDRPVLAAGMNLTTITEDQTSNLGQSVSSFATGISDPDDNALRGVAITGYSSQNGHWEYSIDHGSNWTAFGSYSSGNGLLLASDDKVRFVPNGENGGTDTLTYVAWDQTSGTHGQAVNTMFPGHTAAFSEDSQIASLTVTSINDAPHIDTSNVQITDSGGGAIISGAMIVDPDAADGLMINLLPDSGTVSGTLDSMTYTPPGTPPEVGQIKTTVTDIAGASDTVNFIFNVSGTGSVTMQGTSDKDVFFATSHQDTFVFAPGSNQDVIANGFQSGIDKIDLQAFSAIDATALTDLLADADHIGSDTLLHLNGNTDTVLLKGVTALNASDFILHA